MWEILDGFEITETDILITIKPGNIIKGVDSKYIDTTYFNKKDGITYLQVNNDGDIYYSKFREEEDLLIHTLVIENGSLEVNLTELNVNMNINSYMEISIKDYFKEVNPSVINNSKTCESIIVEDSIILLEPAVLISSIYIEDEGDLKEGWSYTSNSSEIKFIDSSLNNKKAFINYSI